MDPNNTQNNNTGVTPQDDARPVFQTIEQPDTDTSPFAPQPAQTAVKPQPVAENVANIAEQTGNTKTETKEKKLNTKAVIGGMGAVLLLVGGLVVGLTLVRQPQNINEKAASGSECTHAPDCILLEDPGNQGTYSTSENIKYVDITARDYHRYNAGENDDGCYKVSIAGKNLSWERTGSGPDCKDISNIQVWLTTDQSSPSPSPSLAPTPNGKVSLMVCKAIQICEERFVTNWSELPSTTFEVNITGNNYSHMSEFKTENMSTNTKLNNGWPAYCETIDNLEPGEYQYAEETITPAGNWLAARYNDNYSNQSWQGFITYGSGSEADGKIDLTGSKKFVVLNSIKGNTCSSPSPSPSSSPSSAFAHCTEIVAYDENWTQLSAQGLTQLKSGDIVRFTVGGESDSGSFDKARFTINGTQRAEVTQLKPGTNLFYDEYVIPEGTVDFSVTAQVHHVELDKWI